MCLHTIGTYVTSTPSAASSDSLLFGSLAPSNNPITTPFFSVKPGELSQGVTVQFWTLGGDADASPEGTLFWLADNLKAEMTKVGTVTFTTPHGTIETGTPEKGGVWVHWSFVYNPQSSSDNGMAMYRQGKRCDAAIGSVEIRKATPMPDPSRLWLGNSPHLGQAAPKVHGSYAVIHDAALGTCATAHWLVTLSGFALRFSLLLSPSLSVPFSPFPD